MAAVSMEGRVAIVTGAGRALGRAYALLLAARGASVVVNDLGTDQDGGGHDGSLAEAVVEEIRAAGGAAVADSSDVSSEAGGKAVVERALASFGQLDAVVANAGIHMAASFEDTSLADFRRQIDNAVSGTVAVLHAAWPHFKAQGYGRVVTTGSGGGIFGLAGVSAYGAAKGAVQGLTRVLAIEGKPHGILVNMIAPGWIPVERHAGAATEALERQWRSAQAQLLDTATGSLDAEAIGKGFLYLLFSFGVNFLWSALAMFLAVRFKSVVVAIIFYFIIKVMSDPFSYRSTKTRFRAINYFFWQVSFCYFFQYVLRFFAFHF